MNRQKASKDELILELQQLELKYNLLLDSSESNISRHKQVEENLRQTESLLKTTQQLAHIGGWEWDVKKQTMTWTEETYRLHGIDREQLTPGSVEHINRSLECYLPEDRPVIQAAFQQCVQDGKPYDLEFRFINVKKEHLWIRTFTIPVKENDIVIRVVGFIMDITERKQSREELTRSEIRFRATFDKSPVGAVIVGLDQRFIRCNEAFCSFLGYAENEIIGRPIVEFTFPEDIELGNKELMKLVNGDIEFSTFQKRYRRKNGEVVWGEIHISLIRDENNNELYFLPIIEDITQRKKAEDQIVKLNNCFLKFGTDPIININLLVSLCGELMGATCALYNRINDGLLCSLGKWNVPKDYKTIDLPDGHLCTDVIHSKGESTIIIRNLQSTNYFYTDPNVRLFDLKTYIGRAVKFNNINVGSLCVVFQHDIIYNSNQLQLMEIIASAIGVEEERFKAQNALKENEEKLSSILNNTKDVIWSSNWPDFNVQYISPSAKKVFGRTAEEFKESTNLWSEIVHPDDRYLTENAIAQLNSNGTASRECRIVQPDGTVNWIYEKSQLVYDENNNVVRIDGIASDITQRKQFEDALKMSEARFRNLMDDVQSISVQGYASDGTIQYWNHASEKLYGYTAHEAIGHNLIDLIIPPEMREHVKKAIKQMTETGQPIPPAELSLMRKDGSLVSVFTSHTIIQLPGQQQELFSIDIDLAERKLAEAALKKSEEAHRQLYESIMDAVVFIDMNGLIINANGVFLNMLGYTLDELKTKNYRDFTPKKWHEIEIELYSKDILENGYSDPYEKEYIRKDGSVFPVEIRAFLIKNNQEEPANMWAIVRDISKRKQAEEDLKVSELRLRSLVKILQFSAEKVHDLLDFTLEESIQLTNSKLGYIYFYNEQNEKFTLHSWSKEIMKDCTILNPNTQYNLDETGIWGEAVRQRKPIMVNNFRAPNHLKKGYPDGHAHLHKFLTIPVIIENEIVAVIGVANKETDYTETDILHLTLLMDSTWKTVQRKNMEEFVKHQNEELLKLNADKDLFMSILAHDLKSPFNSLLGLSELLAENIRNYPLEKIEKQVNIINKSSQRIYHLLEDISLWARSQSGKILFEPQKTSFNSICREILIDMKLISEIKDISISYLEIQEIVVFADIDMLKTILRNLIANALKFTNNGGRINIYADNGREEVTITVSDNGIGIKPSALGKLFDITQKYSTAGTAGEMGTGLGLILCKDFIEKHGGKIWVESEEGKGTVFYFTIPNGKDLEELL